MIIEYKFIPVTKDEEGARLDRVVRKAHPYLNQGRIEKALRSKLIVVNQQKISSKHRLEIGDHIQICKSLIQDKVYIDLKRISQDQIKMIMDRIIYRDGDLIAINKPSGLAVQGGSKIKVSIDDIMPQLLESMETWHSGKPMHKLVHRLDKETSGVLLIALNNRTAKELSQGFHDKLIDKTYLAILTGNVKNNSGQISTIINKEDKQYTEDNATTNYRVLSRKSNASLVEFRPITGKTHQLRLHALELGFPILGDSKYDPTLDSKSTLKLHLHAMEIIVPDNGGELKIKAEIPEYFQETIKEMKLRYKS